MKKILAIVFILITSLGFGQNTGSIKWKNEIHLKTGKYIRNLQIRGIDSIKVEYIKDGNLCDVPAARIEEMITDSGTVVFSEFGKPVLLAIPKQNEPATEGGQQADTIRPVEVIKEIPQSGQTGKEIVIEPEISDSLSGKLYGTEEYYHNSYDSGVEDAKFEDVSGWGLGAFLLGLVYGAPYVTSTAASQELDDPPIPKGVDAKLYAEGYKQQKIIQCTKSAAFGATLSKVLITGIIFLMIAGI